MRSVNPRENFRQDFDRHVAIQARVVGTVHLAHSADADERNDF